MLCADECLLQCGVSQMNICMLMKVIKPHSHCSTNLGPAAANLIDFSSLLRPINGATAGYDRLGAGTGIAVQL